MPRCKARVLESQIIGGKFLAKIELNGHLPKVGEVINCKWGAIRSLPQNSLWWVYLTWLVNEGGLKEHGHFFPETLHENLKKHILSETKSDDATTTDLNKMEFSDFFEKADKFVQEFFEISTAGFWAEHERNFK